MKEIKTLLFLFITILIAEGLYGCKRYPEGPRFTLRRAKARVTNDWKCTEYFVNGTSTSIDYTLDIRDDKTYTMHVDTIVDEGTWSFSIDKEELKLKSNNATPVLIFFTFSESHLIKRLKRKSMWLYDQTTDSLGNVTATYEAHFVPK